MARQAKPPWVGYSLAVHQQEVRPGRQLFKSAQNQRRLSEGEKPRYVGNPGLSTMHFTSTTCSSGRLMTTAAPRAMPSASGGEMSVPTTNPAISGMELLLETLDAMRPWIALASSTDTFQGWSWRVFTTRIVWGCSFCLAMPVELAHRVSPSS